jgi:acyl-CoA thioesterase I
MGQLDLSAFLRREEPVTWLFTGDSITQGAKHTRGWRSYTELFKERLNEMARDRDVAINTAVGGAGVGLLQNSGLYDRVLRFKPDVLFMMFGTNDAVSGNEGMQHFIDNYIEVLHRLQDANINCIIMQTTVPMMPIEPQLATNLLNITDKMHRESKLHGFRQRLAHIDGYVKLTCQIANRLNVGLIDHYRVWQSPDNQHCHGQLMDGGFHPNEYGHRMIAHTIFQHCGMWDVTSWTCRLFVPVEHV